MLKIIIAMSLAVLFGAAGDILLSKGMRRNGEVRIKSIRELPYVVIGMFSSPFVILGVTSMAVYFSSYVAALAWIDVSIANPLTALSYVIATAYALFCLHEKVGYTRWAGVVLITIGAACVGLSS